MFGRLIHWRYWGTHTRTNPGMHIHAFSTCLYIVHRAYKSLFLFQLCLRHLPYKTTDSRVAYTYHYKVLERDICKIVLWDQP